MSLIFLLHVIYVKTNNMTTKFNPEKLTDFNYEMTLLEPMLSSRFNVEFLNSFLYINPENVLKTDLPKFSDGVWQDISMEFLNSADSGTFKQLYEIVNRHKNSIEINIHLLGPDGMRLGTWEIIAKIKSIDFGTLDYADNKSDSILKSKATFSVISAGYSFDKKQFSFKK